MIQELCALLSTHYDKFLFLGFWVLDFFMLNVESSLYILDTKSLLTK